MDGWMDGWIDRSRNLDGAVDCETSGTYSSHGFESRCFVRSLRSMMHESGDAKSPWSYIQLAAQTSSPW